MNFCKATAQGSASPGVMCLSLIACLALASTVTQVSLGQNTGKLSGTVTDAASGQALPGANVILIATGLGSATDFNGRFAVLGVPVGEHKVRISFVGYQTVTLSGVEINASYTREVEVRLEPGLTIETVVVEYERPLIQQDAIGITKVVSHDEIINLPVRGVTRVAAIQAGVVATEGRDELHVRGGRNQEVSYYIDGVKLIPNEIFGTGVVSVPQAAIQEQEMLIGNISARYGDAMSGVINISTKSGGSDFFGSLEAITSEGLDAYGTSLFSGSLGGPIVRDRLSFFIAGEFLNAHDGNPRAVRQLRIDEVELERLRLSPLVLPATSAEGEAIFVEFPGDMALGARLPVDNDGELIVNENGDIVASDGSIIALPEGATLTSRTPIEGWEVIDPDRFSLERDRLGNGVSRLSGTANLTYRPTSSVRLRLGGRQSFARTEQISQRRVLLAPESFTEFEDLQWQAFASWSHHLSGSTFYRLQVDWSDRRGWAHDPRFSRDVEDLLFYGDIDHPANEPFTRYHRLTLEPEERIDASSGETILVEVPTYQNRFTDGLIFVTTLVGAPGGGNTRYEKFHHQQWRVTGTLTTQVGLHQVEVGGEFEQHTRRRWGLDTPLFLAAWLDDSQNCSYGACGAENPLDVDGDGLPDAVTDYAGLPVQAFLGNDEYYGYDFRGIAETDGQDILDFIDGTNLSAEPWKPRFYGAYAQDKIEFRDIVLNLGVRVDVFDNNALVYRDPFARVPIVRAGSIDSRPTDIGSEYAVYFDSDQVVGYRGLDGQFFNPIGEQVTSREVVVRGTPRLPELTEDHARRQAWNDVFEDYDPSVTIMPRMGVSFPITNQALFFGRYGVVSQRPTAFGFASLGQLLSRGSRLIIPNPDLKPERTVEYEIGFRHRVGENAAFTVSGFFRQIKDLISIRQINNAFPEPYSTAENSDFGTVKGVELNFDLRRTRNVSLNVNYTMSFANGTGSDVFTSRSAVLGGEDPALTVFPLDFDQRHRFNLSLDLRFGRGDGPMFGRIRPLENVGMNVLLQAGSGFPYTAQPLSDLGTADRNPLGAINEHRMPSSNRIDLRVDRKIELSAGTSVSLFLWIQNLLDTQNIFEVYSVTGLPDEDGFRLTPVGEEFIDAQARPETANVLYDHRIRDPEHYGIPRMIRLGARITF